MLNVTRLRILREVASRGTLAAAAEALFMTPSAVSQQMAVLVREAGTPLLERRGRGMRLTDAGARLVENTERILADLESAEADLAASARGVVGRVRVSAFPTAARTLLVPALRTLVDTYPNLHASMIDLEPEESLPALKAQELDVVVTYEWNVLPRLEDPGVEREELLCEPVYLALPATHELASLDSISVTELRDEEWIVGRDSTSMLELVVTATRREGYAPRTDFHSMDFQVILAAVGAGLAEDRAATRASPRCSARFAKRQPGSRRTSPPPPGIRRVPLRPSPYDAQHSGRDDDGPTVVGVRLECLHEQGRDVASRNPGRLG